MKILLMLIVLLFINGCEEKPATVPEKGTKPERFARQKVTATSTKSTQEEACYKANAEARKQLSKMCPDSKVDYDSVNYENCQKEKLAANNYKGTFTISYKCTF